MVDSTQPPVQGPCPSYCTCSNLSVCTLQRGNDIHISPTRSSVSSSANRGIPTSRRSGHILGVPRTRAITMLAAIDVPMMDIYAAHAADDMFAIPAGRAPPRTFHTRRGQPPSPRGTKRAEEAEFAAAPSAKRRRVRAATLSRMSQQPAYLAAARGTAKRSAVAGDARTSKRQRLHWEAAGTGAEVEDPAGESAGAFGEDGAFETLDAAGAGRDGFAGAFHGEGMENEGRGVPEVQAAVLETGEVLVRVQHADGTLQCLRIQKPE